MTPGDYIQSGYLDPFEISTNKLAEHLGVESSTVWRILNGHIDISPWMAIKLSYVLGDSAEFWMTFTFDKTLDKAREDKAAIEAECIPFGFKE